MRCAVPAVVLNVVFIGIALAGDGIRPRPQATDYPAHQDVSNATIAATVLTSDQIKKVFGADVGRRYLVVEVAIYPQSSFDVDASDFWLKNPDGDLARAETPRRVAQAWNEKTPVASRDGVTVTHEAGVDYATWRDPVTGQREKAVGVYQGTTVTNGDDPRSRPAPPPGTDPTVATKLGVFALPEGRTVGDIAGYLYFPKPSKKPKQVGLVYSRGSSAAATLSLPVK